MTYQEGVPFQIERETCRCCSGIDNSRCKEPTTSGVRDATLLLLLPENAATEGSGDSAGAVAGACFPEDRSDVRLDCRHG